MRLTKTLAAAAAAFTLITTLTACSELEALLGEIPTSVPQAGSTQGAAPAPAPAVSNDADYFTVVGSAELMYTPSAQGVVEYCALDELGRAGCAYGELTSSLRDAAQAAGREDMTVDPSGWTGDNTEVSIPALSGVEGSRDYNGWFWNRSHLVADSLGGNAIAENLVTGTRTQNVGSTQNGGMAYTEGIAREYLDRNNGDACPLYYAATPVYTGGELIPRTVTVDMRSCDGVIDTRVQVSNTANDFVIDYATGHFAPVG